MLSKKNFVVLSLAAMCVGSMTADVKRDITTGKTDLKVRYIDTMSVMRDTQGGKKVAVDLEEKRKVLASKIEVMEKEITKAMNEFKTKNSMMNQAARDREEQRLMKMETDYKSLLQSSDQELKLSMQRATERLAVEIDKVVEQIAKSDKLDAVVDKMTGRVLYTSVKADYTSKIVAEMDKNHSVKVAQIKSKKVTA